MTDHTPTDRTLAEEAQHEREERKRQREAWLLNGLCPECGGEPSECECVPE